MATDKKVMGLLVRLSAYLRTRIGAWKPGDSLAESLCPPSIRYGGYGLWHDSRLGESLLVLLSSTFLSPDAARLIMQTVWGRAASLYPSQQAFLPCPASWQSRGTPGGVPFGNVITPVSR